MKIERDDYCITMHLNPDEAMSFVRDGIYKKILYSLIEKGSIYDYNIKKTQVFMSSGFHLMVINKFIELGQLSEYNVKKYEKDNQYCYSDNLSDYTIIVGTKAIYNIHETSKYDKQRSDNNLDLLGSVISIAIVLLIFAVISGGVFMPFIVAIFTILIFAMYIGNKKAVKYDKINDDAYEVHRLDLIVNHNIKPAPKDQLRKAFGVPEDYDI